MAFYRPTRDQIRRRVESDFRSAFQNNAVLYPGTMEYGFAQALVGLSHAKHGRLDQVYRDAFPHLASEAAVVKWASFFGLTQNRATYASGYVTLYGTDGTEIPKNTIITRADGAEFRSLAAHVVGEVFVGGVAVQVQSRVPGVAGNTADGTALLLKESITNVTSACEPIDAFTGGADAETIPALRARLLEALAEPAGGGKVGDYVRWAKEVTGVTRAWEYGNVPKVGDVTVLFMRDLDADPFPGAPEIADVLASIVASAPIALPTPTVQAPIDHPLLLEIQLTIESGAVLADVRLAIITSIRDMLATRASPPAEDGGVLYRSWLTEAISGAVGEKDHKLLSPLVDVELAQWEIPTLADPDAQITWT